MKNRIVRFPLVLSCGKIRQTEELKNVTITQQDADKILRLFSEGKLEKWLRDRYDNESANTIKTLREELTKSSLQTVFDTLGVQLSDQVKLKDASEVQKDVNHHRAVEEITADKTVLDNYQAVAFTQKQFESCLAKGFPVIYLVQKKESEKEKTELHLKNPEKYAAHKFRLVSLNIRSVCFHSEPYESTAYKDIFEYANFTPIFSYDEQTGLVEKLQRALMEKKAKTDAIKRIQEELNKPVRSIVKFGKFENQEISWIVIDKKDNKRLLLSQYALTSRKYNETDEHIEWENSTIKEWLNNEFYKTCFNDNEKRFFLPADKYPTKFSNPPSSLVFLLSSEEFSIYKDEDYKCFKDCENGKSFIDFEEQLVRQCFSLGNNPRFVFWWLRDNKSSVRVKIVTTYDPLIFEAQANVDYCYVRPALWIDLDRLSDEGE